MTIRGVRSQLADPAYIAALERTLTELISGQSQTASQIGTALARLGQAAAGGGGGSSISSVTVVELGAGAAPTSSLAGGVLTLGIPDGLPAGIASVTASGLPAGSAPTVTLGGPTTARTFAFGIPAGAPGTTDWSGINNKPSVFPPDNTSAAMLARPYGAFGSVTSAANSSGTGTVTFPPGRFGSAPAVTATLSSYATNAEILISARSATGFTYVTYNVTNGFNISGVSFDWHAIGF